MAIKRIKVRNFKSFKKLDVPLGNLNILIGANASGKSNFVDIFRFLKDIKGPGLRSAIERQGGIEYLKNVNIGSSEILSLEFVSDEKYRYLVLYPKPSEWAVDVYETIYEFAIAFNESELGFEIAEDRFTQKCEFVRRSEQEEKTKGGEKWLGQIVLSKIDGKVDVELDKPEEVTIGPDDILPQSLKPEGRLSSDILLLRVYPLSIIFRIEAIYPGNASIYDFDPKSVRTSAPIAAEVELAENGHNLAMAIKNITQSEDGKRKLMNLVKYLLDFVDDLDVERRAIDRSHLLKIKETYFDEPLPVNLISDGTVNMIALVVALYFDKNPLAIIEEPARGVHPYLISRVAHMLEDASRNKQIIVTTHNPEMVRHANPENLLLISRDREGFSSISKPSEKKEVKIFLENEVKLEELYVDSLLEM